MDILLFCAGILLYWVIGYILETLITKDLDNETFSYVNNSEANFVFQWLWPMFIPLFLLHKLIYKLTH